MKISVIIEKVHGALAQLGARHTGSVEVTGSSPVCSIALFVCKPVKRIPLWACTGFDGGFEAEEAIRRLLDCVSTGKLNINADEQYALAA